MRKAALRRLVTRVADAVRPVITSVWFRTGILVLTAAVAVWGIERVPHASPVPALLGMLPWAVGKYVLCPLRWHALSMSGRGRWWHIRAYAESELLGLLSPAHAGADLWRMHRLHKVGMGRGAAAAEVALDRLVGAVGLAVAVVLTGAAMPPRLLAALVAVAVVVLVAALLVRWRRPDLFAQRPLPPPKVLAQGLLLSIGYQATIVGLVYGSVTAVGHTVDPLLLVGVFGASQVAGIIPGVHGASPRDGALAFGLTTLGVSWGAAIGAVALMAVLPWLPGLALGGGSFAARRLAAMRAA